jgi:hypothetical protein
VLFKLKFQVFPVLVMRYLSEPLIFLKWEKSVKMVRYFSDLFQVVIRICGLVGGERDK